MEANDIKIRLISVKQLEAYTCFIRADDIPVILNGSADVIGIDTYDDEPVGAAVVETGLEPDAGSGQILVIRHLYLREEYRMREVTERLIDEVCDEAVKRYMSGVVVQIAYPDDPLLEDSVKDRFYRLDDGNTVYELDVDCVFDHPAFKKTWSGKGGAVKRISDLGVDEQRAFMAGWKDHFPKGLSYDHLPGKWLKDYSYVFQTDDIYSGFVLSSELSEERLYIGAVYSEPGQPLVPLVLITILGRTVILDSDYRKVIFAAASDEGRRFCDKLLDGIYNMKKWEIHNYYLEV